ncbi:glycosyltransferase family 9 protein [candidate division KSB1 bacterium]|nr:glycosyltransferase family 9 protein [candidate division KSB1 bacterium]
MNPEPRSILIFRNGSLGNTLVATPAIRAIRERWPHATMHLVVDSLGCELFARCPWFDTIIRYEKHGHDRGALRHARLVQRLRELEPTHAVLFKRFFRNGLLAKLSGARVRLGFRTGGSAPFLNLTVPYDETVSIVDLNLRLANLLDAHAANRELSLFLSADDCAAADALLRARQIGHGRYVVAHYGGSTTAPDFVSLPRLADLLRRIRGDQPVVLIGSGNLERQHAEQLGTAIGNAVVACDLPIRVLAAILRRADCYVGMNSGPAHLAAAAGTPGVVIFRPDDRLERELVKWRPPSEVMAAVVPPTGESPAAWNEFGELTERTARRLCAHRAVKAVGKE